MISIEKPRIETVELSEDGTHSAFVVEPLERATAQLWETVFAEFFCPRCRVMQ